MTFQKLRSVPWAAEQIGIKEQCFYRLARENYFPPDVVIRVGRLIKVSPDGLQKFCLNGGKALPGGWRKELADGAGVNTAA
jgi:hypothetical protein